MNDKKYKIWSVLRVVASCLLFFTLIPLPLIGFADTTVLFGYLIILPVVLGFTIFSFLEANHFKKIASDAATNKKALKIVQQLLLVS